MPQDIDKTVLADFAAKYNLAYPVVQTLLSRGYDSDQKINDFIFAVLDRSIFDASIMKDAKKAALRIIDAINKQEKILINENIYEEPENETDFNIFNYQ